MDSQVQRLDAGVIFRTITAGDWARMFAMHRQSENDRHELAARLRGNFCPEPEQPQVLPAPLAQLSLFQ